MRRYTLLALVLVLTASLLLGCGCTGKDMPTDPTPTVLPTNEEVRPTTEEPTRATTEMTTVPTTQATEPSNTIDRGNGGLEDTTAPSSEAAQDGARQMMPNMN